ncbi:MAG: flagellar protein [Lachnospiraceae bacterium]|nr:flagellar protein [Lachnospiraceae bacterium]MDE6627030.1 flagellar protein [Lachnospiraceae bacterium]
MERLQGSFISIDQMADTYLNSEKKTGQKEMVNEQGFSFREVLEQTGVKELSGLTFSKHANERLASRNINLNDEQMNRLNKGVLQAKEKSIKESLVMMDNIAFIVNVKNNTVVTAMDQDTNDSNVFTNIDGAVIV